MKFSEVTTDIIKSYGKIETNDNDSIISIILSAAKSHIQSYTGLTLVQVDEKEDVTIALMVLCNDMYENRQYIVENDKVNIVVKSILDKHCINFL
jgi:uncharacterized phage protein (predicted DNA packaging)